MLGRYTTSPRRRRRIAGAGAHVRPVRMSGPSSNVRPVVRCPARRQMSGRRRARCSATRMEQLPNAAPTRARTGRVGASLRRLVVLALMLLLPLGLSGLGLGVETTLLAPACRELWIRTPHRLPPVVSASRTADVNNSRGSWVHGQGERNGRPKNRAEEQIRARIVGRPILHEPACRCGREPAEAPDGWGYLPREDAE